MTESSVSSSSPSLSPSLGCTESQIRFLHKKILRLAAHLQRHRRDYSSKVGLRRMLAARQRLLVYLSKEHQGECTALANELGIASYKTL